MLFVNKLWLFFFNITDDRYFRFNFTTNVVLFYFLFVLLSFHLQFHFFLSRMQEYRLDKVHVYGSKFFYYSSFPFLFSVFFPISPFVVLVNFRYYRVATKKPSYRENTRLAHFLQTNASSFISRPFFQIFQSTNSDKFRFCFSFLMVKTYVSIFLYWISE